MYPVFLTFFRGIGIKSQSYCKLRQVVRMRVAESNFGPDWKKHARKWSHRFWLATRHHHWWDNPIKCSETNELHRCWRPFCVAGADAFIPQQLCDVHFINETLRLCGHFVYSNTTPGVPTRALWFRLHRSQTWWVRMPLSFCTWFIPTKGRKTLYLAAF